MKKSSFIIILSAMLSGCTFMGRPSVVNLENAAIPKASVAASLRVESVSAVTNAGVNITVATYNVGRFGETDIQVIRESLENEFARISAQSTPRFSVTVTFSRYVQAFSNSHISLGAVVDYCVYAEGKIVFQDRFFAARDKGLGIMPFGMVKDEFNQRILDRIVADTVSVARGNLPKRESEGTFNDLKSALLVLPDRVYGQVQGFLLIGQQPNISVQWELLLGVPVATWK